MCWVIWKKNLGKGGTDPKKTVGPELNDIVGYATDSDGYVDLAKMQELEGRYSHLPGRNRRCDVLKGPCACGASHF